jgi:hypothetical protein
MRASAATDPPNSRIEPRGSCGALGVMIPKSRRAEGLTITAMSPRPANPRGLV